MFPKGKINPSKETLKSSYSKGDGFTSVVFPEMVTTANFLTPPVFECGAQRKD